MLRGEYTEAGDHGRFKVRPGDVLVHGAYASHADWIGRRGDVRTLNFELYGCQPKTPIGFTPEVDDIARISTKDPIAAQAALLDSLKPRLPELSDWPEMLAQAIRANPDKPIGYWTRSFGLAPATVSRGFRKAFGVSAAQYRATARTLQAFQALIDTKTALTDIATQLHFSDQAHFTRSIRALTGAPPNHWRQVKNLQDTTRYHA